MKNLDEVKNTTSGIITGVTNIVLKKDEIEYLYQTRLSVCKGCKLFKNGICNKEEKTLNLKTNTMVNGCGCVLQLKLRDPIQSCPADKWENVDEQLLKLIFLKEQNNG